MCARAHATFQHPGHPETLTCAYVNDIVRLCLSISCVCACVYAYARRYAFLKFHVTSRSQAFCERFHGVWDSDSCYSRTLAPSYSRKIFYLKIDSVNRIYSEIMLCCVWPLCAIRSYRWKKQLRFSLNIYVDIFINRFILFS